MQYITVYKYIIDKMLRKLYGIALFFWLTEEFGTLQFVFYFSNFPVYIFGMKHI